MKERGVRGRTHVSHRGRECVKVTAGGPAAPEAGECVCGVGGPSGERVYVSKCARASGMQV